MAMSKVVLGFIVAGTLAACSGEQAPAPGDAALPTEATQAAAALKDQFPTTSASSGDSSANFNSNPFALFRCRRA